MTERLVSVVIADDADDVRALVRARLRLTKRFTVVAEGASGAEAVAAAEHHQPDLVLLDVSMPGMDGLDAIGRIRAVSPSTRIVMFSGFDEEGLAAKAIELGAVDFLEKSVPVDVLVDRLLRAVDQRPIDPSGLGDDRELDAVLGEHLERFGAAFDRAAIGMATMTLTGRIVRANAALGVVTGTVVDELIGRPCADLVAKPGRTAFDDLVAAVADGRRDSGSVEHRLADHDRWVLSTVAVVRAPDDQPTYLLLQVQDVTAQHQAEESLRQSEERFRLLVESVADYAIFMLDPTGRVASWNRGAERTKGYTAGEIIGRSFEVFYTEVDRDREHPADELAIATAVGRYEEEGWRVRKDGSTFWANVVITALRDAGGELLGFAKVTRDVTGRMEAEAELAAANDRLAGLAAERTEFLAVTAHELRTPVAVVNGFARTLIDHWGELPDDERREMLEAVVRGGARLSRLVEDLLTASRLEAGALEMWPARIDLGALAAEVVGDLGATADIGLDVTGPAVAYADRGRVQQMINNYLTNALRYGRTPVVVTVTGRPHGPELRVTDAGPGVGDDLRTRLFGRFVRGAGTDGTGLGLFIVRELARRQHGDAWYEDRPEGGACFALRLPAAEP